MLRQQGAPRQSPSKLAASRIGSSRRSVRSRSDSHRAWCVCTVLIGGGGEGEGEREEEGEDED